ncbi:metallophosphoesterase family protein [Paenibacillus abyssi]|uniref:Phosphoesterase n=1 Tax=Paenibacillus abyssi TaxID=1340531 RepID=A0A917FX55_9BACL|nr:YfcE family phosphodiesterase [Paenibacillus abyssi]GGG11416.1 phosphoesterase [Paenibacillus abyssi]
MRIGVLSDTHMPKMAKQLPRQLVHDFRNADLIIHAGDWCDLSVYDELVQLAPVEGVAGNNDGNAIVKRFGYVQVIQFAGKRIGVVHGHGGGRGTTEQRAMEAFKGQPLDVIIFGHSHIPVAREVKGKLLFNPGSPTDKRRQSQYSYGIIEIIGDTLTAQHVFFKNKD